MRIIGITGRKRVGKDTLASRLTSTHGFTRFAFADPLRDAALALDPILGLEEYYEGSACDCCEGSYFEQEVTLAQLVAREGWEDAKDHPDFGSEVRRLLQRLGTEVGRDLFGPDFWVDQLARRVDASPADRVVLTDVRFPNEADFVRARGGDIVRVLRVGHTLTADLHPSEVAMDAYPADFTVTAATTAELYDFADTLA